MRGYLLDTQIIKYWWDDGCPEHAAVAENVKLKPEMAPLYVSAVTRGEIEYGHAANPAGDAEMRADFMEFLSTLPQILPITLHTSEPYGRLRARLFEKFARPKEGKHRSKRRAEQLVNPDTGLELGIDENDLWIAAQAMEKKLILVTNDDMPRIRKALAEVDSEFRVENWAKPPLR